MEKSCTNIIISDCEKACIDDLIKLEAEYDFVFPDEVKSFYLTYNGGKPQKRKVSLKDGDWESSTKFHGFYAVTDRLEKKIKDVYNEDWWVKGLIPFGYDEGGEDFCFSARAYDYGCIYYFISDYTDEDNPENALLKVSEGFSQFIEDMT